MRSVVIPLSVPPARMRRARAFGAPPGPFGQPLPAGGRAAFDG